MFRRLMRTAVAAGAMLCAGAPVVAAAQTTEVAPDDARFRAFLTSIRDRALSEGVRASTFDSVTASLTFNPRVVALDRQQPESAPNAPIPNFAPYRAQHVDTARISRGRIAYTRNRARLGRIEAETGVPEQVMVAIWGHETNYGSYTGDFDLPRSLASLAYEGRRRALFTDEFIATLKMIDRGVPRDRLKGSWAGAFGYPQFLPSVYLRLARDGDGDGRADIWSNEADTLASIANYFVNAGWRRDQPWGFAVAVPPGFDRGDLKSRTVSPRCPRVHERHSRWRTMAEWRALGVVPQTGTWPADDRVMASLIEPDGPGRTAYLLTGNYRVILDYNCSNFYALSVGLLADEVAR